MAIETKKNILFICPAFFGYEIAIKDALIENGYDVDLFDERTSNNSVLKAIFRIKKSLLNKAIKKHYNRIEKQIEGKKYDFFFLIKGEVVPESFIVAFKKNNPNARLIYYTYDSINNNNKNSTYILNQFDKCYSFDFEDVKQYPNLILKHLFYTKEFFPTNKVKKKYQVSFVGTLHSNRFIVMKKLFEQFHRKFLFYYMPAKWYFYFQKLTNREFFNIPISSVSFNKMPKMRVAEIFKESEGVLDIQRYGQTGLTMRTFEVLASGAKLITTNSYIREAEFYNESNIIIITSLDEFSDNDVLLRELEKPAENIISKAYFFEKYFVNNWVKEFFD